MDDPGSEWCRLRLGPKAKGGAGKSSLSIGRSVPWPFCVSPGSRPSGYCASLMASSLYMRGDRGRGELDFILSTSILMPDLLSSGVPSFWHIAGER